LKILPYGNNCLAKVELSAEAYHKLLGLPGFRKWKDGTREMIFRPTANNITYINENWPEAQWLDGTQQHVDDFIKSQLEAIDTLNKKEIILEDDGSYEYKTKPFDHQRQSFLLSREKEKFALLMEQGTGKTKVAIDTIAYLYAKGSIEAAIIIAPNGAHLNFVEIEIPEHLPEWVNYEGWVYSSKMNKAMQESLTRLNNKKDLLKIFSFNIEGFTSDKAKKIIEHLMAIYRCIVIIDESQYIKNPSALRTKYLTKVCKPAKYKRIMTGTAITKGLEDIYSQMNWLDPAILGYDSFYTFRSHFCTMGGFENRQIIGYKNVDELSKMIESHSYRKTKADCLDLPPKLWKRWKVQLTPQQRDIYNSVKKNFYADLGDKRLTALLGIVRLLRLQQITCGWFPADGDDFLTPITGDNPKLEAVRQHCFDTDGKVVIWARFKKDIERITQELQNDHGRNAAVAYYGDTDIDDRMPIVRQFQDPNSDLRYIVAHPKAAGRSITLTACENPIYHSNDFDLELRLQSEDRTHRIGTKNSVTYTDVEAAGTVDGKIIRALRNKKSIADLVNKDPTNFFLEELED